MTKDVMKVNEKKEGIQKEATKRQWNKMGGENVGGGRSSSSSGQRYKKIKKAAMKKTDGGVEDILLHDVIALMKKLETENKDGDHNSSSQEVKIAKETDYSLPKPFTEIQLEVKEISSTGDGLAINVEHNRQQQQQRIYVVPFSTPGDIIKAKVIKHHDNCTNNSDGIQNYNYTQADFISVIKAGQLRDDSRIKCKYFATCSGCQFQMMDYQTQLKHKKKVIERAYRNFSRLPQQMLPVIGDTIGSPLQYGYRTKLTPHFDAPKGYISKVDKMRGVKNHFKETPKIGFNAKGANYTLDIEDCPIGTDAVRMGMKRERQNVAENLEKYTKGATILLRESTLRLQNNEINLTTTTIPNAIKTIISPDHIDFKSCVTDNRAKTTEYVDQYIFTNIANEFFQNNNSILPRFTQYIRDNILLAPSSVSSLTSSTSTRIRHLVDAYSGSGLFTITLSSLFESSLGIDISAASINSAQENARLNHLPPTQARFMAADASELFKEITFHPDETVVLIDPSRKGCDDAFIRQLLSFAPQRIVYVSCNVHTQARDVGKIINGLSSSINCENVDDDINNELNREIKKNPSYLLESLVGFDFFPQTSHVESVAILNRVSNKS
ncbi:tRNA -methyltransferase [Erysiphe neolycopersici]|uniref:tRNA-methyltransferase n=1 Tax=Erysiphe neolycopersici TaxID=212602 RepID=A0A420HLI0_9PEZI|nr:tRNA -methyltransferase [Erysiphe neolycopersici]